MGRRNARGTFALRHDPSLQGQDHLLGGLLPETRHGFQPADIAGFQGRLQVGLGDAGHYLYGRLGPDAFDFLQLQEGVPALLVGEAVQAHLVLTVVEPDQDARLAAGSGKALGVDGGHGELPFHSAGLDAEQVEPPFGDGASDAVVHGSIVSERRHRTQPERKRPASLFSVSFRAYS